RCSGKINRLDQVLGQDRWSFLHARGHFHRRGVTRGGVYRAGAGNVDLYRGRRLGRAPGQCARCRELSLRRGQGSQDHPSPLRPRGSPHPMKLPRDLSGEQLAHALARLGREPLFITQRGRATAVLMSLDAYERSEADRDLLLLLARGEKEIAAGVGHSLEQVLAEAEALLSDG